MDAITNMNWKFVFYEKPNNKRIFVLIEKMISSLLNANKREQYKNKDYLD